MTDGKRIEETKTKIVDGDIVVGTRDFSNFVRGYVKGFKFLNNNQPPRKVIMPRVLFVDKVLIEFENKKETINDNKT